LNHLGKENVDYFHNQIKNFLFLEDIFKLFKFLFKRNKNEYKGIYAQNAILSYFNQFYLYEENKTNNNKQRLLMKIITVILEQLISVLNTPLLYKNQEETFYTFIDFKSSNDFLNIQVNLLCKALNIFLKKNEFFKSL
jgi:hypothetical protein